MGRAVEVKQSAKSAQRTAVSFAGLRQSRGQPSGV
jgi:hypothetical protein